MTALSHLDLHHVTGAATTGACFLPGKEPLEAAWEPVRNPQTGAIASTPAEVAEAQKTNGQRIIEATDRAMAPWKMLNGLLGGVTATPLSGPPVPRAGGY